MIPGNSITPVPIVGEFLFPLTEEYKPTEQRVWGGVAIGDASRGRKLKLWQVKWVAGNFVVSPVGEPVVYAVTAPSDFKTISLAFDTAMHVVLAWQTVTGAYLHFYNTLTEGYETRYFEGLTSSRVAVDDTREFYSSQSDVIFAYTKDSNLFWRQQRERYDVERLVGPTPGRLVKLGLTNLNRLQFELKDGETQPPPYEEQNLSSVIKILQLNGFDPA